jgi:GTP-dependent phosphoenolpyruvate carboxykinase
MTTSVGNWVEYVAAHTAPSRVRWLRGASDERDELLHADVTSDRGAAGQTKTVISAKHHGDVSDAVEYLTRAEATARFWPMFRGAMKGRTMYVLPYVLAAGTNVESAGVQLTDNARFARRLSDMVRLDAAVHRSTRFVRALHARFTSAEPTVCCFAEGRTIWAPSVHPNVLLEARPHALRLATIEMRDGECLPARMAVVAVSRQGAARPLYFGVVAPAEFGRPPAVLLGAGRGRAHRTVANDVVWLTAHEGALHAILCEASPFIDRSDELPSMVPIDALVFCTRRAGVGPLAVELPVWASACYSGTMLTAEADGPASLDPLGMASYSGIDITEYVDRWFALGTRLRQPPKTFRVNWFLRGADGALLWPALVEGWRVVDWMAARVEGRGAAHSTFLGSVPTMDAIERSGLPLSDETWRTLLGVDAAAWRLEVDVHARALANLGENVPLDLHREHRRLTARLHEATPPT